MKNIRHCVKHILFNILIPIISCFPASTQDTVKISENITFKAGINGSGSKLNVLVDYPEIDVGGHISLHYGIQFNKGGLRTSLYYHWNDVNDEFLIEHNDGDIISIESENYKGLGFLFGPQFTFAESEEIAAQVCLQGGGFVANLPGQTFHYINNITGIKSKGTAPGFAFAISLDFMYFAKQHLGFTFSPSLLWEIANIPRYYSLGVDGVNTDPYLWYFLYPELKIGVLYQL